MNSEEFADIILNHLKLERTNDELQNELFEILGFDHFELIQKLLLHRNDIIKASQKPPEYSTFKKGKHFYLFYSVVEPYFCNNKH